MIMGSEILPLYGKDYITDRIGPENIRFRRCLFTQVTPVMTGEAVWRGAGICGAYGSEVVWDLYCGIGTDFSLSRAAGETGLRRGDRAGGDRGR